MFKLKIKFFVNSLEMKNIIKLEKLNNNLYLEVDYMSKLPLLFVSLYL